MTLDPNHTFSSATIDAIRDIMPMPEAPTVDDSDLLRLALGIAGTETRLRCARSLLASPDSRARLIRMRARIREQIGERTPVGDDRADLGRASVFAASFERSAAAAVFPERFGTADSLDRLVDEGWLERESGEVERYALPGRVRPLVEPPASDQGPAAGWKPRFVLYYADVARRIDGTIAEGRWGAGSTRLLRELPNLRAAWNLAEACGMPEKAETLVRSLLLPVMDLGEWEAFGDLLEAGYRAANALGSPKLRVWLLSYEGVAASRKGNSWRARELWTERLRLSRREGFSSSEADTLIDLAGQAYSDGAYDESRTRLDEAEILVRAIGRPDFAASIAALRATDAVRRGDVAAAVGYANEAIASLSGIEGLTKGLFVRISAAQTLVACGRFWSAADALLVILTLCVESGKPVHAAIVLSEFASVIEAQGRATLASESLLLSLAIHREIGTRRIEEAERKLAEFVGRRPEAASLEEKDASQSGPWAERTASLLAKVAEFRAMATDRR